MAIISVNEKVASRRGRESVDGPEYDLTFIVVVNKHSDDQIKVLAAPGLPRPGTPYTVGTSADYAALLFKRTPRQVEKYVWEVECRYDSVTFDPEAGEPGEGGVTSRPTRITYGSMAWQEVAEYTATTSEHNGVREINGDQPIENSAGQPFDPPLMRDHHDLTIQMQKFLPLGGYDVLKVKDLIGKVNNKPWFGLPAQQVMLTAATAANVTESNAEVVTSTTSFQVRVTVDAYFNETLGWNPVRLLDRGRVAFASEADVDGENTGETTKDKNGVQTGAIVKLDGNGKQLHPSGRAVYLDFDKYETADFDGLNLP